MSLEEFPLTPNGKIDRFAFPPPEQSRSDGAAEYALPTNAAEEQLILIWAELLVIDPSQIGIHDDFFELGGHSLLATRVIAQIRKQFGATLSLFNFFEGPTISALAGYISTANGINGFGAPNGNDNGHSSAQVEDLSGDDDREEFVI